jgi:hypothetical protein
MTRYSDRIPGRPYPSFSLAPNVDEGMTVDAEIKVVGLGIYE